MAAPQHLTCPADMTLKESIAMALKTAVLLSPIFGFVVGTLYFMGRFDIMF